MAITRRPNPNSYFGRMTLLKKLIWLYFLLLVFEGALRKWVAPQLSGPLLVIRAPFALMIIWEAFRTHKWPVRWTVPIALFSVLLIGLFAIQCIAGENSLVGLFGLYSYLVPIPVIFIMGENLDAEDLRKFGNCTMILLLLQAALAVAQYIAPPNSFINNGAYEGATQIAYVAGESSRASGTFSFVIGLTEYSTLAAAFIFYGMAKEGFAKKWLLWASTAALLLMIPMTGSRATVVQLAAVLCCAAVSAFMGLSQLVKVLRVVAPIAILAVLVSFLPVFSSAMQNMTARFTGGAEAEAGGSVGGSIFERTIQPAIYAAQEAADSNNWIGIGIGRGAVAVQQFLLGTKEAVGGENEFSREVAEMGPIAASFYELLKLLLGFAILAAALGRVREQEPLSLLLVPLALTMFLLGVPEQPTEQGFIVIGTAFCIAAARLPAQAAERLAPVVRAWRPIPRSRRGQRG